MQRYIVYQGLCKSTGKKYIGCTKDFKRRLYVHKSDAKTGRNSNPMYEDIRKYGWEDFEWCELLDAYDDSGIWEKFYIKKFSTLDPYGYNMESGGKKGYKSHPDTIDKMSAAKTGKKLSTDTRKKMSAVQSGENHHMWGKKHSTDTRKKISDALIGRFAGALNPRARPVLCVTTGEIFLTVKAAAEAKGCIRQNIIQCCQGNYKTAGGFKWEYFNTDG